MNLIELEEGFTDKTGGNKKIRQTDYLSEGLLPIIDQGQKRIAGYTNDLSNKADVKLPCVIFGDHTRIFKFIDFPFALGADGVKILEPSEKVNALYAYYFLGQVKLGGKDGYNRNYKYLKEIKVPLPDLKTQQKIAGILEQADAARQKRKQANQLTEAFLQSAFLEMFGDPVRNEMGWEKKRFGEVSESRLGKMLDEKKQKGFTKYPYLGNSNVKWGRFEFANLLEMEFSEAERKELELQNGDLLICEGGEIGRCAIWRNEISNTYFQKAIHRVRLFKDKAMAEYIQYLLWYFAKNNGFKDYVSTSTISHLTGVKLKSMLIPLPPLPLQKKFASLVEQVEQLRVKQRESEKELENLFQSLMQRYFG